MSPADVSLREFIEARIDDLEENVTSRLDRIEVQTTAHNGRMTAIEAKELARDARAELIGRWVRTTAKILIPLAVIALAALTNADKL